MCTSPTNARAHTHTHTTHTGPLWPNGPAVKLEIPAFFTMNRMAGVLQEGAIHTIKMMGPTQYGLKQGWRVGFIWCHKQECISGMSKTEAKDLMQEFFAQRRQERVQENELLQDRLEDPQLFVEKSLENKEWMGGSFLDSVNFLKQDKNAPPPKTASGLCSRVCEHMGLKLRNRASVLVML